MLLNGTSNFQYIYWNSIFLIPENRHILHVVTPGKPIKEKKSLKKFQAVFKNSNNLLS